MQTAHNVPEIVLKANGFASFNPMQEACIKKGFEKNLVVSAPTASGKTIIAELFALDSVINHKKKVIYTCPLRALAGEHYKDFKRKYSGQESKYNIKFALSTGDLDSSSSYLKNFDVIMTTYEKLASLLRHKSDWLGNVGCIIIDEVHELDSDRGPVLEIALTQMRNMHKNLRVLGLSATIPNAKELSDWLEAELVESNFRPVKLKEGVLLESTLEFGDKTEEEGDLEDLMERALKEKKQFLFFMNSRKRAEAMAKKISESTVKTLDPKDKLELAKIAQSALEVLESPTEQCSSLADCIRAGAAFHHAGLMGDQKDIVEENFRKGKIRAIAATPTLCLVPETEIWQGNTAVRVDSFGKLNERLIALKNDFSVSLRPSQIVKNPNTMDIINITSVCGHSIKLTENHRLLIKRNKKRALIEANKVRTGDKIATTGKLWIPRPQKFKIGFFTIQNAYEEQELDKELAYFIGIMLGDGCSGMDVEKGRLLFKGSPSIVGRDPEIFEASKRICQRFDLHYRETKNSYGVPALFFSKTKWFRMLLANTGILKGQRKHICDELKLMGPEQRCALIKGLFDTDGCVEKVGKVSFSNNSLQLIKDTQRILLNFGIISLIRSRKGRPIKMADKEYISKDYYELIIAHKRSIVLFNENVGFGIKRKQNELTRIVNNIKSNQHYASCPQCKYRLYNDLFSGRTKKQKEWGMEKLKILKLLGTSGPVSSANLGKKIGNPLYKGEKRLDHHFELIKRTRVGNEKLWELNEIGKYIHKALCEGKSLEWFLNKDDCPICRKKMVKKVKNGWREKDFEGDIFWDNISRINKEPAPNYPFVYDVVLPDDGTNDHLFAANGFFVHNSAGVNTPADIVVIPSLYRFAEYGMELISVREYKQMSGRSGRPKFSREGKSIVVANSDAQKELFMEKYVNGPMEPVLSRMGIISVLRTHILALIATNEVYDVKSAESFFGRTLYAHQLQEMSQLLDKVMDIISDLVGFNFVEQKEGKYYATPLGKRVSDLFLDPESAAALVKALVARKTFTPFAYLFAWANCTEFSPWINSPKKLEPLMWEEFRERMDELPFSAEELMYGGENLNKFFSALMMEKWINEKKEQELFADFGLAPGLLFGKTRIVEWLAYSTIELSKVLAQERHLVPAEKLSRRVKYGVKEELLALVELRGIGRFRARKLFSAGITKPSEVKKNLVRVERLLGKKVADSLAKQLNTEKNEKDSSQMGLEKNSVELP